MRGHNFANNIQTQSDIAGTMYEAGILLTGHRTEERRHLVGRDGFALIVNIDHNVGAIAGDGAEGCKRIKAVGGTTFAQDTSAEISSMSRSAQATGCVDFVLSADKIPAELDKLIVRVLGMKKGCRVKQPPCAPM